MRRLVNSYCNGFGKSTGGLVKFVFMGMGTRECLEGSF